LLISAFLYFKFTKDTPAGNFDEIERNQNKKAKGNAREVLTDWRVWALAISYSICFGMEITFDNVAALHFVDNFGVSQKTGGLLAGLFGFMNLFARALGGIVADAVGKRGGLGSKGVLLAVFIIIEGIGLYFFGASATIGMAITSMVFFALFLKMANGATYALTPFINEKNVGLVAGIVGAGGNIGGMLMGFLFKFEDITYAQAFQYISYAAIVAGLIVAFTKFGLKQEEDIVTELELATELIRK
jgi:NNP family nitrate/nitrite transporter-like MFS transporter